VLLLLLLQDRSSPDRSRALVMALQLPTQQQQQQQPKPRPVLLYEPGEGETGLSIKASSDGRFIILTSSIEVSSLKTAANEQTCSWIMSSGSSSSGSRNSGCCHSVCRCMSLPLAPDWGPPVLLCMGMMNGELASAARPAATASSSC
jgi:hypothetical protein